MARKKFIAEPDTALPKQELLFDIPGHKENSLPSHPPISRKIETLASILSYAEEVGIDFEFTNVGKPTIVSVTSDSEIFAAPWSSEIAKILKSELEIPDTQWVAHSGISADRPVVEAALGIKTPLSVWDDSMVTHYLCNQHLTKAPAKEESDDAGALGFMDLWTMASLTTGMFNWKKCRGVVCYGPCPAHSPVEYCGVDAWAGLVGFQEHKRIMKQYGVPDQLYRDLMEVGEICYKMEQKGIHIDKPFVDKMELDADARKNLLFPVGEDGKQTPFNPRSVKQVTEWFKAKGIDLRGTDKKIIYRTLEKEAVKNGFASVKEISDFEGELPEALQQLYNLHEYKDEGKGLDAWFGPRYLGKDSLIHSRFVNVGTSTGRLSSSRPNFQNIPARGFGDLVRRAVVAPEGYELLKSDFGQLELRMCLYLAGVGPEVIGKDAFTWLVENSGGLFLEAAALYDSVGYAKNPNKAARNIAKRVAHACLTGDHEVLTPGGWIRIEDWKGEKIAQWAKDGSIEFNVPTAFHYYEDVEVTEIQGTAFDQCVTENHKFPVFSTGTWNGRIYEKWHDVEARDLNKMRIPLCGVHEGRAKYCDNDLRKAIAIQADGSRSGKQWRFHVKKQRKINRLEWLFGKKAEQLEDGTYSLYVDFKSPLLTKDKKLSWEFLNTTAEQKRMCIEESKLWDGSIGKNSSCYNNSCIQSLTVIQTLAHLSRMQGLLRYCGPGNFEGSRKDVFRVSFNKRNYADVIRLEKKQAGRQNVFCFTTDTGYFLVRRNGTISVTGNSDYLEGIKVFSYEDLEKPYVKNQIEKGALRIYSKRYNPELKRDWEYFGGVVGFTGVNLAEGLFGSATFDNRKKALGIQEDIYFKKFFMLREWQMKVTAEIEARGYIKSPTGRFMRLYDAPHEMAKIGVAWLGQGVSADHVQGVMLRYHREFGEVPIMQVHDELVFEKPATWTDRQMNDFIDVMRQETYKLPGFKAPIEVKRGKNWKDLRLLEVG